MTSITAAPVPRWPAGWGNVFVRWTGGYGVGATPPSGSLPALCTIPPDCTTAVNIIAAWLRASTPRGAPLDPSQQADALRQQMDAEAKKSPAWATLASTVRFYREVSVGSA